MKKERYKVADLIKQDNEHKKKLREAFYRLKKKASKYRDLDVELRETKREVDGLAYGMYFGPVAPELETECEVEEDEPR